METLDLTTDLKTALSRAARNALQCQDACNLSGVGRSFADALDAINAASHVLSHAKRDGGTRWKNRHPVVFLFVHKLADLAGCEPSLDGPYAEHSRACERMADGDFGPMLDGRGRAECRGCGNGFSMLIDGATAEHCRTCASVERGA